MQKKYSIRFFFLCSLFSISHAHALKIDRVIVSSDANPLYLDFWPLVAKTWKKLTGITPTLILVADKNTPVDTTVGDVVRFEPIAGINHGFQAQIIRLLAPALFENDGCLISDIDMFPLCKDFFVKQVASLPEDSFVVYRDKAHPTSLKRFPMCYSAAQGKTFKEVFQIPTRESIPAIIQKWHTLGLGWNTDEILLYQYITSWKHYKKRCVLLGNREIRRIDRSKWWYIPQKVRVLGYLDAHSIRPYKIYKKEIDSLLSLLDQNKNWQPPTLQKLLSPFKNQFFYNSVIIKGTCPLMNNLTTCYRQDRFKNQFFR